MSGRPATISFIVGALLVCSFIGGHTANGDCMNDQINRLLGLDGNSTEAMNESKFDEICRDYSTFLSNISCNDIPAQVQQVIIEGLNGAFDYMCNEEKQAALAACTCMKTHPDVKTAYDKCSSDFKAVYSKPNVTPADICPGGHKMIQCVRSSMKPCGEQSSDTMGTFMEKMMKPTFDLLKCPKGD